MFWRVFIIVIVGILDMALFGKMVWGPSGIIEYQELKRQYSNLQDQIATLDAKNINLSRDIRLLQTDNQFVEKMIRQKLRYMRGNEIVYLFPNKLAQQNGDNHNDRKN